MEAMYNGRKVSASLHFIVVGGGIGGLSAAHCLYQAGHKVTLVDPSDLPAEIGAGVSLSPNVTRLFARWGLKGQLEEMCDKQGGGRSCDYLTDELLFHYDYSFAKEASFYGVHRPFLVTMLYDLVKDKATILKGKVSSVDAQAPSVTLSSGQTVQGDVIIGADGIGSVVRPTIIPPLHDQPVVSGDVCYRALIPIEDIKKCPELSSIILNDLQFWEAEAQGGRIIAYGIGHGWYNFVLVVTDPHPEVGHWSTPADLQELQDLMKDWTPRAAKLVSLVTSAIKFKLVMRAPTDKWVHPSGKVALLGDAAHAMLPYYAQGAAMAIEDADVLGNLFSRLSSRDPEEITSLLKTYQTLRVPRANLTHAKSLGNGNPDTVAAAWYKRHGSSPSHSARSSPGLGAVDRESEESVGLPLPDFVREAQELKKATREGQGQTDWRIFTEKQWTERQYGYDADEAVDKWWRENRLEQGVQSHL